MSWISEEAIVYVDKTFRKEKMTILIESNWGQRVKEAYEAGALAAIEKAAKLADRDHLIWIETDNIQAPGDLAQEIRALAEEDEK